MMQSCLADAAADPPDPVDPPVPTEMEHELQLATYRHSAGGQDVMSLIKLPQITITSAAMSVKSPIPSWTPKQFYPLDTLLNTTAVTTFQQLLV